MLIDKGITITTAESCTGGLLASYIVSHSGVSSIYSGSIISYSNEIKHRLLGVSEDTLSNFGAVSKECVKEMCDGAMRIFNSDIAIGVSGVAGPNGGTKFNPIGSVVIGIKFKDIYEIRRYSFSGDREGIQQESKCRAFELLKEML
jgi:nicotinamide-nucleotide amidase